jgi:hypothetical protein
MIRKFIISTAFLLMSTTSTAEGPPPQVIRLQSAISALPGITEVQVDKTYLPSVEVSDLSLPGPYADLPIAVLRRSKGALPNELLISIGFRIKRDEAGLKALEFMSWWVRDQSRGGEEIQIRSIGLPPIAGPSKQLGQTLRFTIDWFYRNPKQDLSQMMSAVEEKAKSIELAYDLYKPAF